MYGLEVAMYDLEVAIYATWRFAYNGRTPLKTFYIVSKLFVEVVLIKEINKLSGEKGDK